MAISNSVFTFLKGLPPKDAEQIIASPQFQSVVASDPRLSVQAPAGKTIKSDEEIQEGLRDSGWYQPSADSPFAALPQTAGGGAPGGAPGVGTSGGSGGAVGSNGLPVTGKVAGPFDRFRDQPPEGVSVVYWNEWLDKKNASTPPGDKSTVNFITHNPNWAAIQASKDYAKLSAADRDKYVKSDETITGANTGDPYLDWGANTLVKAADKRYQDYENLVNPEREAEIGATRNLAGVLKDNYAQEADDRNKLGGLYGQAGKDYQSNIDSTNALQMKALDNIRAAAGQANAADAGALSDYAGRVDPLYAMREGAGWGDDVQSDAESLGLQRQVAADAGGVFDGSLDYQSQAAGAYADPRLVQQQQAAFDQLRREAETGDKDQRAVYDKQFAQSDPAVTAQERAVFEQIQRSKEASDRNQREGVMADLARRGLRSPTAVLAATLGGAQTTGQDRMAGYLGLSSQAVQRALQSLRDAGGTATSMRGLTQAAQGRQYDASSNMRTQDFGEEYARGQAADDASANNQSTRVQGLGLQGQVAGQMRSAADAMSQFNKSGSQMAAQWQDSVAMQEARRVGDLANQQFGNETYVNDKAFGRTDSTERLAQDTAGKVGDRTAAGIDWIKANNTDIYGEGGTGDQARGAVASGAKVDVDTARRIGDIHKEVADDTYGVVAEPVGGILDVNNDQWLKKTIKENV